MKKKLLVVDDEKDVRDFVKDYFSQKNYEVLTAESGVKALEQAELVNPDLILLDVEMPGMNGLEVLANLREKKSPAKVIMVTGQSDSRTVEAIMRLGADHYIVKPLTLAYLESQVKEILSQ